MIDKLIPELQVIEVEPIKLILDPNNPRLLTKKEDLNQDPNSAVDSISETIKKMEHHKDKFRIEELKDSIRQNGWISVDYIFVKKIDTEGRYLVLEGNRRVTAVRALLAEETLDDKIRSSIKKIEVMEIIDKISDDDIREKISYLLGVRHHGALQKWSPFAQAHNIYKRYMQKLGDVNFNWNKKIAEDIGNALSIKLSDVEKRLKVYIVMKQLSESDDIKNSEDPEAEIKDHYYSVCEEVVTKKLPKDYITVDSNNFELNIDSINRMINLCHFDRKGRVDAPISNPQEWRKLHKILDDPDPKKVVEMMKRVEINKEKPSNVYAERSSELQEIQWDGWLKEVKTIVKDLTFEDVEQQIEGAKEVTDDLYNTLEKLIQLEG